MNDLWLTYKQKARDIRPFLRTKTGSRLAIFAILDFIILFFAPLIHGFVGTAIFGCVATVFLMLIWRRYDREHAVVPAAILCIPLLLDMIIYHNLPVVVGCLVAGVAVMLAALSPIFKFYDRITDKISALLAAGGICVGVVIIAWLTMILVDISWWILCIIAFVIVVAIFMGVVFSTAAYTASDGRRQERRDRLRDRENEREHRRIDKSSEQTRRYREYKPRERDNTIYNLTDDDFRDTDK